MLFMNIKDGQPDPETAQVVRIRAGTQLVIPAGKAHFVPVAEGDEPVEIIVVAPKMDAPRMPLPFEIVGIS
jgi:oxalate decarboxylase/phosphoglucose isomerase-like protein (cupin superfamily)